MGTVVCGVIFIHLDKLEPHIDANTILCITNDDDAMNVDLKDQQVEEIQHNKDDQQQKEGAVVVVVPELLLDHEPQKSQLSLQPSVKPVFTVFDKPPRRPRRRSLQNVPIHQIEVNIHIYNFFLSLFINKYIYIANTRRILY